MKRKQDNILTDESSFVMKESKTINLVIAVIMFILAFIVMNHIFSDYHTDQLVIYKKLIALSLIPAIVFTVRGFKNKVILTINKHGIFRCGVLTTNWDNFIKAYISQDQITGSYADNFVLLIEFYKEGEEGYFRRKINLTNTRDKSEEEIIEAIRYFSKFSKNLTL